ncbi:unannotated protein [freshwater metagenome]
MVASPGRVSISRAGLNGTYAGPVGATPGMERSLLGSPLNKPVTAPVVALALSAVQIAAGVAVGLSCSISAATPATCGEAIDVPLPYAAPVSDPKYADKMFEPGAKMSLQDP